MTWGNSTYPGRPVADRVSFACLTAGPGGPETPYMQTPTLCVNGMRAQIAFQSCWNGVDLYKQDNSHVAYLNGIDNGICPPGFPVQVPTLFLEVDYAIADVPNDSDGTAPIDSRFVFSQGDPTGYGYHGDFQNGWEPAILADAVSNCLYNDPSFGTVQECPVLLAADSNGYPFNCPEQPPQVGEAVKGLLTRLPGCINVTYGPEVAPAASMMCAPGVLIPSITRTVDSTPIPTAMPSYGQSVGLPNEIYLGCFVSAAS